MVSKKEVYEIKHVDPTSDRVDILAEVHLVKDNKLEINWKKDYGTPKFSIAEFQSVVDGLNQIAEDKRGQLELPVSE